MISPRYTKLRQKGFALIVTLSLMILLTVIAVGLLSLATISLRSSGADSATSVARANARMALMLALGELQKTAGDDRRVTADGSILDGSANPNVVGVWKSWSPKLAENPSVTPPYSTIKSDQFVAWLTSSGSPVDLSKPDWAKSGSLANPVNLYTEKSDGFILAGSKVDIQKGTRSAGTMAWAVVQDATRAKINVAGPEQNQRQRNDDLQAQPRPSLAKSDTFNQPAAQWNQRSNRVISMSQARLDKDLWKAAPAIPENYHFTSQGFGLLTDVVNGGLKTDLSLGFEMSETNFKKDAWGAFKNPFRGSNALFATPSAYQGERPIFKPLTDSGSVRVDVKFAPASTTSEYPAAAVPTFTTLRSFYRTPYHLYKTPDGPTVFERGLKHVALKQPSPAAGYYPTPGASPLAATASQTSYRPILDRVLYVFSAALGPDNQVRLILTPIVTLWNPYNVALEIEGAVAYPWVDLPLRINWKFYDATDKLVKEEQTFNGGHGMAAFFGKQFATSNGTGRTVNPYFFAAITPQGSKSFLNKSIRFAPGEIRVFAPVETVPQDYRSSDSISKRTVYLRPVEDASQYSIKGGFSIPMYSQFNASRTVGFTRAVTADQKVVVSMTPMDGKISASDFWDTPFNIGVEDATRFKAGFPENDNLRGQSIGDVQTTSFVSSGAATTVISPPMSYPEMLDPKFRKPFGMFETYHRVATDTAGATESRKSDLVFTTNPRQPFINNYLTTGSFEAGPSYKTKMTPVFDLKGVMETSNGRSAFYGASNTPKYGRTHISFFEVPTAPLLSLASFQHADLSGTFYSPANQFGNSWASAYLKRDSAAVLIPEATKTAGQGPGAAEITTAKMPVYDYSYLTNEALWDSFFFSGAAPTVEPGNTSGSPGVWDSEVANVSTTYDKALQKFIDDSTANSLRNPRMRLLAGKAEAADLKTDLLTPEGCLKIAAKLRVDGVFNVNSTSEKAWIAFLSGMKDAAFDISKDPSKSGATSRGASSGNTAFSRFRNPIGLEDDHWMGFRTLNDPQIAALAKNLVLQVKQRGPFLSLGEFVNRRIENSPLGLKGAVQAAIDDSGLNATALYDRIDTSKFPTDGKNNIDPPNAGVGIPGYLTQADVLQSLAPVVTVRSDTFTIRAFGEAKDPAGRVVATSWCEAVVQRNPEFVDPADAPDKAMASLNATNRIFGRKFLIVSFRFLSKSEVRI